MAADTQQTAVQPDKKKFWKGAHEFYGAVSEDSAYCAVLGWSRKYDVVAAHFVPKLMKPSDIAYLLGEGDVSFVTNPKNCEHNYSFQCSIHTLT